MKLLFLDLETSGLNAWNNGIIQMTGIIEINGEVKDAFNYKIMTFKDDVIDDGALKVTNTTREMIKTYMDPFEVYNNIKVLLTKYVNPFDKTSERFTMVGYNADFDNDFMKCFFNKVLDIEDKESYDNIVDIIDNVVSADVTKNNVEWLKAFFIKNGDKFFTSFCRGIIDVRQMYYIYLILNNKSLHNTRLDSACDELGIELKNAHDAKADIIATRKVYKKLLTLIKDGK
jgi:DNA polymerase III epsilon subunit-like protein